MARRDHLASLGLAAALAAGLLCACEQRKPDAPAVPTPKMEPSTQTGNPKGVFTNNATGDVAAPGARPTAPGEASTSAGSTPDTVGKAAGSNVVPGGGLPPAPMAGSGASAAGGGAGR